MSETVTKLVRPPLPAGSAPRYSDDCERIVAACRDAGYEVSMADAEWAWEQHSDTYCAGWLMMGAYENDASLVATVRAYLVEEPNAE